MTAIITEISINNVFIYISFYEEWWNELLLTKSFNKENDIVYIHDAKEELALPCHDKSILPGADPNYPTAPRSGDKYLGGSLGSSIRHITMPFLKQKV